jgi:hypothetical protein
MKVNINASTQCKRIMTFVMEIHPKTHRHTVADIPRHEEESY